MVVERSNFESVLKLTTQDGPPQMVHSLLESCDAMVPHEVHHHALSEQVGVGPGTRSFPFPRRRTNYGRGREVRN
jgi:hypothetical protein